MQTDDFEPIKVGYIIWINANHGKHLPNGVPIPTTEWAKVLEIDEAKEILMVELQDGRRTGIWASQVLSSTPQEEWERQSGKKWKVKNPRTKEARSSATRVENGRTEPVATKTLYHFTSQHHLAAILETGGLRRGDVPTAETTGFNAVWLTSSHNGACQLWADSPFDRTLVRMKVICPGNDPALRHWPALAQELGVTTRWQAILAETGGNPEEWFVYMGEVPLSMVESIDFRNASWRYTKAHGLLNVPFTDRATTAATIEAKLRAIRYMPEPVDQELVSQFCEVSRNCPVGDTESGVDPTIAAYIMNLMSCVNGADKIPNGA